MSATGQQHICSATERGGLCRALRIAWRNRAHRGSAAPETSQREFLPAALQVQESPASPAHHWLLALLLSLFVLAVQALRRSQGGLPGAASRPGLPHLGQRGVRPA